MSFIRNVWDGLLSLLAALATIVIVGVPLWGTHMAIDSALLPVWAYLPMAGLLVVGGIMVIAFLRKASGGVAPLRDRKR